MDPMISSGVLITSLPDWTPYAAVAVGGLAGATYAARRGFDAVGVFGLTFATGLGGLLLRDILLERGTPVVFTNPWYLVIALIAAIFGFFFAGLISQFDAALVLLDGLSVGFFAAAGAIASLRLHLPWPTAIFIGTVTAVGGIVIRDVLSGTAPVIVRPGQFVTVTAVAASSVFVGVYQLTDANFATSQVIAMLVALFLRIGTYWFGWSTGRAVDMSDRVWEYWARRKHIAQLEDEEWFTSTISSTGWKLPPTDEKPPT